MNEEDGWNNEGRGKISFSLLVFLSFFYALLPAFFVLLPRVKRCWFVSDFYKFVSSFLFLVAFWQGSGTKARVERRRSVAQHLRQRGRPAHVPPAPGCTEHRLYSRPGRLHAWPARLGAQLVDPPARNARCRWRCHSDSTSSFSRLSVAGWQQRSVLGLGPWTQQTLSRFQEPGRYHLSDRSKIGRKFHRAGFILR